MQKIIIEVPVPNIGASITYYKRVANKKISELHRQAYKEFHGYHGYTEVRGQGYYQYLYKVAI